MYAIKVNITELLNICVHYWSAILLNCTVAQKAAMFTVGGMGGGWDSDGIPFSIVFAGGA